MLCAPSWDKIATEQVVADEILDRMCDWLRPHDFMMNSFHGPAFTEYMGGDDSIATGRQWDLFWPDGDIWKGGLLTQGLYVSPSRDLVIA